VLLELKKTYGGEIEIGELGETIEAIREKIETVLQQLPENYAQILRLRFFQQMTLKECAEHLQITLGNVKVLQYRALQKAVAIAQTIS
jgi:RNA polymerase sigma factor (sigma-70 family)